MELSTGEVDWQICEDEVRVVINPLIDEGPTVIVVEQPLTPPRTHQCPKCSRLFNRASALASHLKIHDIVTSSIRSHTAANNTTTTTHDYDQSLIKNEEIHEFSSSPEDDTVASIRGRKRKVCECIQKSTVRDGLEHMRQCPAFQQRGLECRGEDRDERKGLIRCDLCPYYYINKCCSLKHKFLHHHKIMKGDDDDEDESEDEITVEECTHYVSAFNPSPPHTNLHLCGHCGLSFVSETIIKNHMTMVHVGQLDTWEPDGSYECRYCSKSFKHMSLLQSHCQSHIEGSLICDICGKNYKNNKSLQGHVKKVHLKEQYSCTHCTVTFNSAQSLTLHVRKTHTKEKPCVCQYCGESFYMMYSLKNHERSRHADLNLHPKILCDLCGYEAKSRRMYMRHRQYQHAKEFGLQSTRVCDICGKVVSKRKFYQHKQMVHSTDYRYVCGFENCDKKFNNSKSLRTHSRIHDPSQWFHCSMCPQVFTHRASVHRHMKVHSGDKPYRCEICNLSFTQGCSLTRHKRIHSGDSPYSCRACGIRFKQQSLVVTHYNRLSHRSCRDFIQRLGLTPNAASQLTSPPVENTRVSDNS